MEFNKKGKKIVISIIVVTILVSVISTLFSLYIYAAYNDTGRFISQLVKGTIRLSLECVIFIFLYKGREWAKHLFEVLYFVGGIFGFISSIALFGISVFTILMVTISILYVIFAFVLITSKSVESFLSYKRDCIGDFNAKPEEDHQN